jgi:hypothetical protein
MLTTCVGVSCMPLVAVAYYSTNVLTCQVRVGSWRVLFQEGFGATTIQGSTGSLRRQQVYLNSCPKELMLRNPYGMLRDPLGCASGCCATHSAAPRDAARPTRLRLGMLRDHV